MSVMQVGDRLVRIRDVGYAELGALNERSQLRGSNRPVAGLFFRPLPGANQVDIVDEMRRRLEQIEREVPSDVTLTVAFDNTKYVRRSIHEVQETVFVAFALVVVVVFGFFREWRTTLIPILAIPVSIIGVFFLMEMVGFSINVLTLLGVVLAIGLVVDDAIVVLENIHAKITKGMKPRRAAVEGTREILMPVIATTITLAVVFLPLLFLGGLSGRLFREFGITLAGAVLISAFVALTLTPMLCARLLRCHQQHSWLHRVTEPLALAATILGILPIALSLGAGSESRASMGIAAVGGVAIGGFLTLFVIPATYVMLSRRANRSTEESESDIEALSVTSAASLTPAQ